MEPIAIVGIGCRFPGAHGPEELWKLLCDGVDAITEVPSSRWNADDFYDADPAIPGKMSTRWGGFLRDVDCFDREFFGISPREAAALDPQQRLLLEVTWEALEDAGQVRAALTGSDTGVFVGISTYDYALLQAPRLDGIDVYWGTGNALSIAANRISYMFDLRGPSIAIDTACSSSLVAVHMACQSLASGESQLAIAGGVNVILSPGAAINFTKAGVMAPDGRCKTFDASADGYVRGEGAGIVVLKPLARALADRDAIRAVIRGGAIGQDGRTNGLMAPNRLAQEAVLNAAYRHSGVAPGEVDYVEAHGTGTLLGDMMEAQALGNVLGRERPSDRPCAVGSLKSNIGHLEAAAGVAGLIKTALMLEHRQVPSSLHVENPNPQIDFEQLRLRVARTGGPWPHQGLARAGVSSFGFGGTNAHLVLEEAPPGEADRSGSRQHPAGVALLPISARTPEALRQTAERLLTVLDPDGTAKPDLDEIAYTAAVRRSHHRHRLALVTRASDQARDQITAFRTGEASAGTMSGDAGPRRLRRLVLVCSGQGPRWWPLDPALLAEPALRTTLAECDQLIQAETGWSLLGQLADGETECHLDEPDFCQPALFALQVALANLWRSWGITPDAVVGHSMGEVAAAHLAGALSLEDAVRVICHRGRLIRTVAGSGRMAFIGLSAEATHEALRGLEDRLSLAAVNSPASSVISGEAAAIEEVVGRLRDDGVFCRILESVDFASHSGQMDPLTADLAHALRDVKPAPARLPMYSTVTGLEADGATLDGSYWAQNLRAPVLFGTAVAGLLDAGHDVFLELSPHPVLLAPIAECAQSREPEAVLLASLRRDEPPREALLTALGRLYTIGFDPAWDTLYPGPRRPLRLPNYPWQRDRYWFGPQRGLPAYHPGGDGDGHPLLGHHVELADLAGSHVWEAAISAGAPGFLDGHRVDGVVVVPAAGWLEMARAAAAQASGEAATELTAVEFQRMLVLDNAGAATTQLRVSATDGQGAAFHAYARPADGTADRSAWSLHVTGKIASGEAAGAGCPALDLGAVRKRCGKAVAAADHYRDMRSRGLEYGPVFQAVEQLWLGEQEALAELAVPPELAAEMAAYGVHPALLDAALQVLAAAQAGGSAGETPRPYVPIGIDRVVMQPGAASPGARGLCVHARLRPGDGAGPFSMVGDVWLADGDGRTVAVMEGVHARRLDSEVHLSPSAGLDRALYEVQWRRQDRLAAQRQGPVEGGWLIFADTHGVAANLAGHLAGGDESAVLVIPGRSYDESDQDQVRIRPEDGGDVRRAVAAARERLGSLRGVVHLWSLDAPAPDQLGAAGLRAAQVPGVVSVLHLVHALAEGTSAGPPPRLWLVTSGVHRVGASQAPLSVAQSPVWGLGRVTAFEHPELRPTLVDLDPALDTPTVAWLAGELREGDAEDQLACRAGERYAARLVRAASPGAVPADAVREDASYLITGGLGALGLHVAGWLAEHGARHLLLLGRRDPGQHTEEQLQALRAAGAEIRVVRADVADEEALARILTEAESMPPLRGVVHAAGILDDATLRTLSPERLLAVLEPKVAGAWNLHNLTAHLPLDFFVMFSSAAAILGSPGQGNYAAANAFLDALASLRASHGRAALSIAWGPWANTGLAVRDGGVDRLVALAGVAGIDPAGGAEMLGRLLGAGAPQVAVMDVDWRRWAGLSPVAARLPLVAELVGAAGDTPSDGNRGSGSGSGSSLTVEELLAADPADRQQLLESYLRVVVARALDMPPGQLDADMPLNNIGLDSLVAVGFKNQVEVDLGMSLPLADALEGASLRQLAEQMLSRTTTGGPPQQEDGLDDESWEEFEIR